MLPVGLNPCSLHPNTSNMYVERRSCNMGNSFCHIVCQQCASGIINDDDLWECVPIYNDIFVDCTSGLDTDTKIYKEAKKQWNEQNPIKEKS